MNVDELTSRLVRRFGDEVTGWCAAVPALAGELVAEWSLTLGAPLSQGASSVALRCRLADGTPAVLKLSPDREFLAEQVRALRLLTPSGRVPVVLAARPEAVLMEAIEPGIAADELADPPTVRQWSDLLTDLHRIDPPPGSRTLAARCEEFFTRIGRRLAEPRIAGRVSPAMWARAMDRCRALLATQPVSVLLHGDLHLGNVLHAGPIRGLVAIDPKACLGDPCFDAVDYLLAAAGDPADPHAVTTRSDAFAETHGLDPDRLRTWCRAVAPVVAVALISCQADELAIAELLALAR